MRNLFGSGAETDDQVAPDAARDCDDALGERIPTEMWLDAIQHHKVTSAFRVSDGVELVFGPANASLVELVEEYVGTLLSEIEERVWVDIGDDGGVALFDHPVKSRSRDIGYVEQTVQCDEQHRVAKRGDFVPVRAENFVDRRCHAINLRTKMVDHHVDTAGESIDIFGVDCGEHADTQLIST